MRIGILGGGFTGLTAGLRLLQKRHEVDLFEKEPYVGGLAVGFKEKGWEWFLEKAYHHWFTNDTHAIDLAKELHVNVVIRRPSTDIYMRARQLPFDSPLSLLAFPYLSPRARLQTGFGALYLKLTNNYKKFEGKKATSWIRQWMGEESYQTIWEPLFTGKFGSYKEDIALTWFWARIKKRTPSLAYPEGGFQVFAERIADEITRLGGQFFLGREVSKIKKTGKKFSIDSKIYDKVILTLPTPIFIKLVEGLPKNYIKKISQIQYLHALNLILILEKPFMEKTYWLNVTDKTFPFLVLVEHTNFMDPIHYGGQHIIYIGNYLPRDHRYLKMTKEELLKELTPFLRKINPNFQLLITNYYSFVGPFAQPIVTVDYPEKLPTMETPIPNIYLANLSMVYPWDRGTNYAIELGEKVANLVMSS